MAAALIGGSIAGVVFGYVLQRSQQCFHATFRGLLEGRLALFKAWLVAVAVGALGLTGVYELGPWEQLNTGLGFRPVSVILGGVVFGIGMVVASSCVSGLFYKLGAGMLGAFVGLAGWGIGEVAAGAVSVPGPRLLDGGEAATIHGVLGVPRVLVAALLAVAIAALLWRTRRETPEYAWQWSWPLAGLALGAATVVSWVSAGISGASFGASTSGAVSSIVAGSPVWWRVAFLVTIVLGAHLAARTAGGWWTRGETRVRYAGLAVGGALLGAGARIAGGCNLGHGLSGVAQLNVSSFVAVGAMIAGVALAAAVKRALVGSARVASPVE